MDNLLKNAIADAKAVRETALINAKLALEEAFTPKIQSMLAKKIQSETEGEYEEDEEATVEEAEEFPAEEDEEFPAEEEEEYEEQGDEEDGEEKDVAVDVGDDAAGAEEVPAEEVPAEEVPAEEEEEYEEGEDDDLDLEAIIRELEGEETEEDEEYEEQDDEEVTEQSDSSDIGTGDNKVDAADSSDEEDPQGAGVKSEPMDETFEVDGSLFEEDEEETDENIDLEEILKSLTEEEEETEEDEEEVEEVVKLRTDLDEHRKVIKFLRTKLNEINLLNAKLLFTNKLFKAFNLNNEEKLKVVETFDRANNLREVKLVYSTVAESLGYASGVSRIPKKRVTEGSASKAVASTKPKKVISEGNDLATRFKKLAGLNG